MTGLADRGPSHRPDVIPSPHGGVWGYGRAGRRHRQLCVYPARVRSSGEFTQAVIHVTEVRAAVEEMRGRGVEFEEYDTPETRTENGIARMPGGGEAAWFKDSEGNLV